MDLNLMNLRQRVIETSNGFIQAHRACLDAIFPNSRKSQMEMKEAAEEYLKAAKPYEAALQELHQYLLAAEPSEAILAELERTKQFIKALDKEIEEEMRAAVTEFKERFLAEQGAAASSQAAD